MPGNRSKAEGGDGNMSTTGPFSFFDRSPTHRRTAASWGFWISMHI